MAKERIIILIALAVLVAVLGAAWWYEGHVPEPTPGSAPAAGATDTGSVDASSSAYAVKITRDGHVLASFDLAQLEAVGMKRVVVQGGEETGPPLLDVLARAGVTDATTLTILGEGIRDSGRLVLALHDVGPDTVLDIAKRGTVKVAGPKIPREWRVRDITEIQVR